MVIWKQVFGLEIMHFGIIYLYFLLTLAAAPMTSANEQSPLLLSGHSHNDYRRARPLWDALENNFISIEVDIHLVGQALLVGHDKKKLRNDRTLQSLYLNPLRSYINDHDDWVYPGHELILLLDIKSSAGPTYKLLRTELAEYSDILTAYAANRVDQKAVAVVISGHRPRELMLDENIRYATYDGRLRDLDREISSNFTILISDNWEDHFVWRGHGPMPAADRRKLTEIIGRAHSKNYRIRFWNLPTNEHSNRKTVWAELISLGVDLISVDDLEAYRNFMLDRSVSGTPDTKIQ